MILNPFDIISFFSGIVLLYYCSDLLIDNGSLLAKKYNVSKVIIGMSLVAFGTSLPEFIVSIIASYQGKIDLVTGNIIGSNIANIGLVVGLSGTIYLITYNFKDIKLDILFLIIATLFFSGILYFNHFTDSYGLILILILFIYVYILVKFNRITDTSNDQNLDVLYPINKLIMFIILGSLGLSLGSYWLIEGAIGIARYFNISDIVIGATAIALGTSLPELAASLNAAKKNEFGLVLGNIFGSNIINIVLVFSTSLLINQTTPKTKDFSFDLFILLSLTILLVLNLIAGKIYRSTSLIFIGFYVYYIYIIF